MLKLKQIYTITLLFGSSVYLSACHVSQDAAASAWQQPNQIVTKTIPVPTTPPAVASTYPLSQQSQIIAAYNHYSHQGIAKTINGDGFRTIPYDIYQKPILACAPQQLCVVQLQQGEHINDIALGDAANWQVSTALIGSKELGSYQVSLKPNQDKIATDLIITTNLRSYHLGLVSKTGQKSQILSFYYPEMTLQQAIVKAKEPFKNKEVSLHHRDFNITSSTSLLKPQALYFHYRIQGKQVPWRPVRVFDDGQKTFIQMPANIEQHSLPVLYVMREQQRQLANYRYQAPYLVIDGLVEQILLIAGHGQKQKTIKIINKSNYPVQYQSPIRKR